MGHNQEEGTTLADGGDKGHAWAAQPQPAQPPECPLPHDKLTLGDVEGGAKPYLLGGTAKPKCVRVGVGAAQGARPRRVCVSVGCSAGGGFSRDRALLCACDKTDLHALFRRVARCF